MLVSKLMPTTFSDSCLFCCTTAKLSPTWIPAAEASLSPTTASPGAEYQRPDTSSMFVQEKSPVTVYTSGGSPPIGAPTMVAPLSPQPNAAFVPGTPASAAATLAASRCGLRGSLGP